MKCVCGLCMGSAHSMCMECVQYVYEVCMGIVYGECTQHVHFD